MKESGASLLQHMCVKIVFSSENTVAPYVPLAPPVPSTLKVDTPLKGLFKATQKLAMNEKHSDRNKFPFKHAIFPSIIGLTK